MKLPLAGVHGTFLLFTSACTLLYSTRTYIVGHVTISQIYPAPALQITYSFQAHHSDNMRDPLKKVNLGTGIDTAAQDAM